MGRPLALWGEIFPEEEPRIAQIARMKAYHSLSYPRLSASSAVKTAALLVWLSHQTFGSRKDAKVLK